MLKVKAFFLLSDYLEIDYVPKNGGLHDDDTFPYLNDLVYPSGIKKTLINHLFITAII